MFEQQDLIIPGGIDFVIEHMHSKENVSIMFLRLIRSFWKDAVVEEAYTGEKVFLGQLGLVPEFTNMFVYKNEEAYENWSRNGFIPGLENTMIHCIIELGQLTLVVDGSAEMLSFIKDLKNFLYINAVF